MRRRVLCLGWCLGLVLTSPFTTSGTPATSDANATDSSALSSGTNGSSSLAPSLV